MPPSPATPPPSLPAGVPSSAQPTAGTRLSGRRAVSRWARLFYLPSQTSGSRNPDDPITVSTMTNAAGVPIRWREVGPWQGQEVGGEGRLAAVGRD